MNDEGHGGIARDDLAAYLGDYLEIEEGSDYGPNGLQVEGVAEIHRIVTGVSACLELFQEAAKAEAQGILVHHGIFWDGMPYPLVGFQGRRVRALIENGLNLFAYHLPLDRHAGLGNNALAAEAFGLVDREPFATHKGLPIGFRGRFETPVSLEELVRTCEQVYEREPLVHPGGGHAIRSLGIVSGGAEKELYQAIDAGLDAYVTGEVSEWVMNVAREAGIHFLSAGHYATERLGIRTLGEHVAQRFGLDVRFVDVPNPV